MNKGFWVYCYKNDFSFRDVFLLGVFLLSVRLGGVQVSPRALDRLCAFD